MSKVKDVLRSSETWALLLIAIGGVGVQVGLIPKELWEQTIVPGITYAVLRITGKVAKTTIK